MQLPKNHERQKAVLGKGYKAGISKDHQGQVVPITFPGPKCS